MRRLDVGCFALITLALLFGTAVIWPMEAHGILSEGTLLWFVIWFFVATMGLPLAIFVLAFAVNFVCCKIFGLKPLPQDGSYIGSKLMRIRGEMRGRRCPDDSLNTQFLLDEEATRRNARKFL